MSQLLRPVSLASLWWMFIPMVVHGDESVNETICQMAETVSGHQLRYLVQTPDGEPPEEGWPLLLFLHGYGECGDDIEKVKVHGPPKLRDQFEQLSNCVIVSPQCPNESWWRVDALKTLMDEVIAGRTDLNPDRRYVTGLSMGGFGIWSYLSHYPNDFVAAVPICGGGDPLGLPKNRPPEKVGIENEFNPEGLKQAKDVPIWTFHGSEDEAVPIAESEQLVELLHGAGSKSVMFTTYEGVGHVGAWEKAYSNPDVWKWLFSQSRPPAE